MTIILSSFHISQAQQLIGICREYILGLSMEIQRKELPKVISMCRVVSECRVQLYRRGTMYDSAGFN